MPNCGSQIILCDVPIRFDTYVGCSHGCRYCFANKFNDISKIANGESPDSLRKFINGERTMDTRWCDWDIPIHWGGMSDPFQPCEKTHRRSYESLKVFKETQYPFIVSTKGRLVADDEYLDLLSECNCVVQISMVCSQYDKLERGCPTYEERLEMLKKVSSRVQRTIVRIQPYMHEVYKEVKDNLKRIAEAGAYGVVVEGMKFDRKHDGLVRIGGDSVYPYKVILADFLALKEEAHKYGLKIYAGENRIRKYGDAMCCCGIDGLDGFKPNEFNLIHLMHGDKVEASEGQKSENSAQVYHSLKQTAVDRKFLCDTKISYEACTYRYLKEKGNKLLETFGFSKK